MEEYRSIIRDHRMKEIKGHAVAFLMLALSLFALYTHTVYLAIIPLLWMAFRAGKERGREQAQQDIEQARALAQLIQFPEKPQARVRLGGSSRLTQFPQP